MVVAHLSEKMKVPVREMKLAKYETFIEDIDSKIRRYRESGLHSFSLMLSMAFATSRTGNNTALALVYDYKTCNEYAKVITDKSTVTIHRQDNMDDDLWKNEYPTYDSFSGVKGKIDAAKKFVELCRKSESESERYRFIFWALLVLTVDQSDAEEHLSLICDLANMLHITDDEFEDIIQVVKIVCNGSVSEYKFKSEKVSKIFNGVLSEYTS